MKNRLKDFPVVQYLLNLRDRRTFHRRLAQLDAHHTRLDNVIDYSDGGMTACLSFRPFPSSDVAVLHQIFYAKCYEVVLDLLRGVTQAGRPLRIVDIGSNAGYSLIYWKKHFPDAKVVGVEPAACNYSSIRRNLALNGLEKEVTVHQAALWPVSAQVEIVRNFRDRREASFAVRESPTPTGIPGVTLDEILGLAEWEHVDLLKIDIEGSERFLFQDDAQAAQLLARTQVLALEIHDEFGMRPQIYQQLDKAGFHFFNSDDLTIAVRKEWLPPVSNPPLVSIIMAAYNAEKYVRSAIQSVLDQTYPHWELLIINDGSTDGTEDLIAAFHDHRIQVFKQPNKGPSAARNRGLGVMTGSYFTFLDADDLLTPESLELRVDFLRQHPDTEMLAGDVEIFGAVGQPAHIWRGDYSGNPLRELARINSKVFCNPSCLIRHYPTLRYCFDTRMKHVEDLYFYLSICAQKPIQFKSMRGIVYRYRRTPTSAMGDLKGLEKGYWQLYRRVCRMSEISMADKWYLRARVTRIMCLSYLAAGQVRASLAVLCRFFFPPLG